MVRCITCDGKYVFDIDCRFYPLKDGGEKRPCCCSKDRIIDKMGGEFMGKTEWIICPICKNKTRLKIREDTVLENFPLFCPKCKKESLINIIKLNMSVIIEPDA